MYYVTITETRSITIPCKHAKSADEALVFVATEYRDNRHSALATDEDWHKHSVLLSCDERPGTLAIHAGEYD